jgi:hypothetical protein
MATAEEKDNCVLWHAELLPVAAVKKRFTAHSKNNLTKNA